MQKNESCRSRPSPFILAGTFYHRTRALWRFKHSRACKEKWTTHTNTHTCKLYFSSHSSSTQMGRAARLGPATEQAIITHSNEHVRTVDRQALPPATHTHTHASDRNTLGTDESAHTCLCTHIHTLHVAVWERSINGPAGRQAPYGSAVLSWSSLYACHVSAQLHTNTHTHMLPVVHFNTLFFCPHHHTAPYVLLILSNIPEKNSSSTQVSTKLHDALCFHKVMIVNSNDKAAEMP